MKVELRIQGKNKKYYLAHSFRYKGKVKKMIAYGMAAPLMEKELSTFYLFTRVETLTQAVCAAKMDAIKGDIVLLSPGCSSFDQFRNYAHRGDVFKQLVREELL